MQIDNFNSNSFLDQVRNAYGDDGCKTVLRNTCETDKEKAVELLNDELLTFPCLYSLLPEIKSMNLAGLLNAKGKVAAAIADKILHLSDSDAAPDLFSDINEVVHVVLRWIMETGCNEENCSAVYERILDVCASVLLQIYKDSSILPLIDEMIFQRKNKGHHTHDLVWAFFKSKNPDTLGLVGRHLLAPAEKEYLYACNLLRLEPVENAQREDQYHQYMNWLDSNRENLEFTNESNQYSSSPVFVRVLSDSGNSNER